MAFQFGQRGALKLKLLLPILLAVGSAVAFSSVAAHKTYLELVGCECERRGHVDRAARATWEARDGSESGLDHFPGSDCLPVLANYLAGNGSMLRS